MRCVLQVSLLTLFGCFMVQGLTGAEPKAENPNIAQKKEPDAAPPKTVPTKRPVRQDASGPRLLGLDAGDKATITFSSTGCFHNERFELVFAGSSPQSVQIRKLDVDGQQKQGEDLGAVSLNKNDWKQLSKAIASYRSGRKLGTSTTTDDISISWPNNKQEHFTDTSGIRGRIFNVLISRATEKKQPQAPAAPNQPH